MHAMRIGRFVVTSIAVLVMAALQVSAGGQTEAATGTASEDERLSVFVSILPQRYFAQRIGGETVEVSVVVPPGQGPATYEPTPRQVTALGNADVYLRIGVPFEGAFVPRIEANVPDLPVVDTSRTIDKRSIEGHSHDDEDEDHDEGEHEDEEHEHDEGGRPDPHVWLGPDEVKKQIAVIRDTLIDLAPQHESLYRTNYEEFARDIDELSAELSEYLSPLRGSTFYVFHPAFGYFGDAFGLNQVAIETGGDEPTPAQLERIIRQAKEDEVRVIFVQPEFSQTAANRVAQAIDGAVVQVNPLNPDWLANMRDIARALKEGLS